MVRNDRTGSQNRVMDKLLERRKGRMELFTTIRNRAAIVRFLEECTGLLADYAGAPTFNYMVGEYTVLRNGHIRVADDKADRADE